jgi:hypothetical protein
MNQPFKNKKAKLIQKWWKQTNQNYKKRCCLQLALVIQDWYEHPDNPITSKLRLRQFKSNYGK